MPPNQPTPLGKLQWLRHAETQFLLEQLTEEGESLLVASCELAQSSSPDALCALRTKLIQLATLRHIYESIHNE